MAAKNAKDKLIFIEPQLSVSQVDYLAIIYDVRQTDGTARCSDIAAAAGVTRSTASTMLKLLRSAGYLTYETYGPIKLTEKGEAIAVNVGTMRDELTGLFEDVFGMSHEAAHRTAAGYKSTVHPQVADQIALLRRFIQKNKKKWKKKLDEA